MATVLCTSTSALPTFDTYSEETWADLIVSLRPYVRHFVYSAHVACWHGQEGDIIEDIVQETLCRVLERSRQGECGEASPIYSLEYMSVTIARNYGIDKMRRDCRLRRASSGTDGYILECAPARGDEMNSLEIAIEHVHHEELFARLAYEVARFPSKQQRALLIDLANRMCFDIQPTPLQKAFLAEGIDLEEYQQHLSGDPVQRSRHAALVSLAYKRIAVLMREYLLAE